MYKAIRPYYGEKILHFEFSFHEKFHEKLAIYANP